MSMLDSGVRLVVEAAGDYSADTLNELLETWNKLKTIHTQARDAYRQRV